MPCNEFQAVIFDRQALSLFFWLFYTPSLRNLDLKTIFFRTFLALYFSVKLQGTFYWFDCVKSPVRRRLMLTAGHICDVCRGTWGCRLLSNTLRNERKKILRFSTGHINEMHKCNSGNEHFFKYLCTLLGKFNIKISSVGHFIKCCSHVIASAVRDERRFRL